MLVAPLRLPFRLAALGRALRRVGDAAAHPIDEQVEQQQGLRELHGVANDVLADDAPRRLLVARTQPHHHLVERLAALARRSKELFVQQLQLALVLAPRLGLHRDPLLTLPLEALLRERPLVWPRRGRRLLVSALVARTEIEHGLVGGVLQLGTAQLDHLVSG